MKVTCCQICPIHTSRLCPCNCTVRPPSNTHYLHRGTADVTSPHDSRTTVKTQKTISRTKYTDKYIRKQRYVVQNVPKYENTQNNCHFNYAIKPLSSSSLSKATRHYATPFCRDYTTTTRKGKSCGAARQTDAEHPRL